MTALFLALLVVIAGLALAAGRSIFTWLVLGEISGAIQDRLVERVREAAGVLPPECADDLMEEWLGELEALKDRPRKAVVFTRGLRPAAEAIAENAKPVALEIDLMPDRREPSPSVHLDDKVIMLDEVQDVRPVRLFPEPDTRLEDQVEFYRHTAEWRPPSRRRVLRYPIRKGMRALRQTYQKGLTTNPGYAVGAAAGDWIRRVDARRSHGQGPDGPSARF